MSGLESIRIVDLLFIPLLCIIQEFASSLAEAVLQNIYVITSAQPERRIRIKFLWM